MSQLCVGLWSIDDIFCNTKQEKCKQKTVQTVRDQIVSVPSKREPGDRFPQPISLQQMKENSKLYVPDRSRKNNTWSMNVSKQWITFRNQQSTI